MTTPNTPPPPAHTAGRLTINEHGRVITESGQPFRANGVAQTAANFASDNLREAEANARRLVALWNACEALPTEALERGAVERLRRERDRLFAHVASDVRWEATVDVMTGGSDPTGMNATVLAAHDREMEGRDDE